MLVFEVVLDLGGCCEVGGLMAFFGDAFGDRRCLGLFSDFQYVCHHEYFLGAFCLVRLSRGAPAEDFWDSPPG